ncbi:oligosaccharide flippase family protein, partial [Photobacterium swingsii]
MVFIKKFFAIISGNIAVVISSFIIAAVLVRDYGLEDYGKFVVMQSLFMVFPIITRPLVWQAVVKFKNEIKSQDAYNHSLKLEIMSFALISVVILFCFKLLLVLFPSSTYFIFQSPELFSATLLLSLPYNSGAVVGYYRSKEKYKHLSSVLTFSSMVKLMVVLFVHK